jgi:hypothetical protein
MTQGSPEAELLWVWVDGWQQECCGEPWGVRSTVHWMLADADLGYFAPLFPDNSGVTVDRHEDHHDALPADTLETVGVIVAIRGVHLSYAPAPGGDPKRLYPVPGSARLTALDRSNGAELRGQGFAGYLVRIQAQPV